MDKASLGLIFQELFTLYHKGVESLEPQDMHFSDFSDWLSTTSDHRAEEQEKQREFWTETLKDVQPTYLMSSMPSEQPLSDLTQIEGTLDASTLETCHKLMKEAGATPSEAFFAVYNTLLYKYSSQETMVVGTAVTQRKTDQLANVVGPLTAFIPVKTTVDPTQTFQEYFTSFKANLSESVENSDIAYEDLNPEPSEPSLRPSQFRHSFAYNGMNLDAILGLEKEGVQVKNVHALSKTKEEDQELLLDIYGKTGRIILQFNNHLFSQEDARKFLDTYITFVEILCHHPYTKMCETVLNPDGPTAPETETIALETDSVTAETVETEVTAVETETTAETSTPAVQTETEVTAETTTTTDKTLIPAEAAEATIAAVQIEVPAPAAITAVETEAHIPVETEAAEATITAVQTEVPAEAAIPVLETEATETHIPVQTEAAEATITAVQTEVPAEVAIPVLETEVTAETTTTTEMPVESLVPAVQTQATEATTTAVQTEVPTQAAITAVQTEVPAEALITAVQTEAAGTVVETEVPAETLITGVEVPAVAAEVTTVQPDSVPLPMPHN